VICPLSSILYPLSCAEFLGYVEPMELLLRTLMAQQQAKMQQELEEEYNPASFSPSGSVTGKSKNPPDVQNVEKVPLTFTTVEPFLGVDPYRELRMTLDGYDWLDMKGLLYWKDRLKKYGSRIDGLKSLISAQLDEKRNFMSFMLTIITTVLAPLALLTGYFGMNFDNMKELEATTYPSVPGIALMWLITGTSYAFVPKREDTQYRL
jgi:hypothetical protein